jgi:hypothetical protein
MNSAFKRLLLAVGLATLSAWAAEPGPPVLDLVMANVVSRPGRNGKAPLVRQLLVEISKWQSAAPEVKVLDPEGTAHVRKLDSPAGGWRAVLAYETRYPGESAFSGEVKLDLTMDDAIVRGTYAGSFNGTTISGRAGAGLAWPLAFAENQGLVLWIAHPAQPVRGIIAVGNGGEIEQRQAALGEELQAMASSRQLAVLATAGMRTSTATRQILDGLDRFAEQTERNELETAPIFFMGHSGGGAMALTFNRQGPERTGGYVSSHGNAFAAPPKIAMANPGLMTAGENDPKIGALGVESTFVQLRLNGARIALAVEQGGEHPMGPGSMPLFLYWLEHVIDARLPPGAKTLRPIDESRAWWADNSTWKDGITAIQPESNHAPKLHEFVEQYRIEPVNGHVDFHTLPGSLRFSWLPDKDVAYVYRGLATYNNPLKLARTGDHPAAYLASERVELECADFGQGGWKRVSVYDGATLLGEITPDHPRLSLPPQRAGAHAGVLVGEMANGELRTSLPVAWAVWP